MFFKRTALVVGWLIGSCGLCAFDLQYGSFFEVQNIRLQQGRPVLPLARGQYANLRVLDKATFELLKNCGEGCRQEVTAAEPQIFDMRAALTRPGMWIAEVSFGGQWLITFLVFQNETGFWVKEPEHFIFLDKRLQAQVQEMLSRQAARRITGPKPAEEPK